jgi:hypothetical protein
LLLFDDRHFVFEMAKISSFGLVNQGVSICQKQYAFFGFAFPEAVDNLKCCVGFSCTGCHGQQDTVLSFGNGFYSSVDGNLLIVAWGSACAIKKIILCCDTFLFFCFNALIFFVALPECFRRRELIKSKVCFYFSI